MTLQELVDEACNKSKDFSNRVEYRLVVRKKQPDREWLLTHLINILGREYVEEAMQKHIASKEVTNEQ